MPAPLTRAGNPMIRLVELSRVPARNLRRIQLSAKCLSRAGGGWSQLVLFFEMGCLWQAGAKKVRQPTSSKEIASFRYSTKLSKKFGFCVFIARLKNVGIFL